jgi:PAS domain S-box-containing protein
MFWTPYVLSLIVTAGVSAALALYAWRRRPTPGVVPFTLVMLAIAWWSLWYALEFTSVDLPTALFLNKIQYLGVVTVPVAWLAFVLEYTGWGKWLTRHNLGLLAIVPLVTLLLAWTNEAHNLIWRDAWLNTSGPFAVMSFTRGLWYWVNVAYAYLLLLPATLLLIHAFVRSPYLYRRQAIVLLIGALAPWVGNALYMSGLSPFPQLDLTPFAFTFSGLAAAWGLFRGRLLDVVLVARDAVIKGMSDGVIVMDAQDRVVDLNPAAGRIIGCPASEMIGQPVVHALPGWSGMVERYHDVTETQAGAEIVLGEGEAQRTYDLRVSPLYDWRGRLTGRLVVLRDITERKRAEETLRESEERFRAIFETAQDSIFIKDRTLRYTQVNPAMERLFKLPAAKLIGQTDEDLFGEEAGANIREVDSRVLSGEIVEEERTKPVKGIPQTFHIIKVPMRDNSGEIIGLCGIARNVTEHKQAEEALQESEERYRTLVTQSPIGVVTCDRGGNITHANPALLQTLGSPGEEATRQFNMLTMPNLVEAGIAADFRRCMEEATQITAEYPYRSHWGKESVVRLRLTPLRDEGEADLGEPLGLSSGRRLSRAVSGALATVEDVTEQRRLQEQLVQSAKLASIGQLAAGVAHEINNPLNGIINYAQLLLNKAEPGGRQARFLEGILREGDRVTNIVRDLLTFARVEHEAHSPAHVPDILRATLTLADQQLRKDSIILEIEEQPNLPQIKCRSQRIQQVFLNLISNARHALNARYRKDDPNKRLTIRIEQVEKEGQPYVRTTFHDQGVGIPAQNLPHVFTPFFTTKKPGEGTGLGLSVSYGIVQDHHGNIQVESVEGEYTIFRVDLPVDNGWEL